MPMVIELNLEPLLTEKGKTFYWLGKEAGINQAMIWKFRHGLTQGIQFDVLAKICEVLECQPGDILQARAVRKSAARK